MKKTLLFFSLFTLGLFGYRHYFLSSNKKKVVEKKVNKEWKKITKVAGKAGPLKKALKKDLESIRVNINKKKKRSPSSVRPTEKNRLEGRVLTGPQALKYKDGGEPLVFVNDINPDWQEIAGENLLRHRLSGTQIFLKLQESFIKVLNGKGRYVEKIQVTSVNVNGQESSFNALVDSGSGKVISTWNQTIHENYGKNSRLKFKASPLIQN